MTADEQPLVDEGEAVVASLSTKLAALAETLEGREREVLACLLHRAMDPIERVAASAPADLLAGSELELLRELEGEGD